MEAHGADVDMELDDCSPPPCDEMEASQGSSDYNEYLAARGAHALARECQRVPDVHGRDLEARSSILEQAMESGARSWPRLTFQERAAAHAYHDPNMTVSWNGGLRESPTPLGPLDMPNLPMWPSQQSLARTPSFDSGQDSRPESRQENRMDDNLRMSDGAPCQKRGALPEEQQPMADAKRRRGAWFGVRN